MRCATERLSENPSDCGTLAAALVLGKSLNGGKAKGQQACRSPKKNLCLASHHSSKSAYGFSDRRLIHGVCSFRGPRGFRCLFLTGHSRFSHALAMPAFACILATYNRPAWTVEAVESVLAQTLGDFECIVVDDGSTDETPDRLAALNDPRLRIVPQPHRGVAAARNHGVALSSSAWLAFLDSDDRWLPRKMEGQMAYMAANRSLRISQTDEIWIRRGARVNPMRKHRKSGGELFVRSLELCVISPSAVVLARSLFDEVGGFDETFPVCEDYDLWLRITCREPVGFLPEPLVVKRGGHDDQLSRSAPVMDRYRIRAIDRILRSGQLNEAQRAAAIAELERKCRIVAQGSLKRGNREEAEQLLALVREHQRLDSGFSIFDC